MTENSYDTLWELFEAISKHAKENKATIESKDDPKRLLIGWGCPETQAMFYIKLRLIRDRTALILPLENEEVYNIIISSIIDSDGRKKIATMLNSEDSTLSIFANRVMKLKAFW